MLKFGGNEFFFIVVNARFSFQFSSSELKAYLFSDVVIGFNKGAVNRVPCVRYVSLRVILPLVCIHPTRMDGECSESSFSFLDELVFVVFGARVGKVELGSAGCCWLLDSFSSMKVPGGSIDEF